MAVTSAMERKDNLSMIDRNTAVSVVILCLRDAIEQSGTADQGEISEETVIVGKGAALDSMGVVSLIVDVEQRLEMDHGVSVTLANDKAMSQRSSPFRTVGVLADHIGDVIKEGLAA
jgi:acyl carrier protein